ncbi:MAG TPA: MMPL family transporter [Thermoleophilaceae bacterium]
MAGPLYALGRGCIRFRWLVLGAWLLVVLALVLWSKSVGSQTSDNLTLPGSDSQNATDVLNERFPVQANGTNPVVMKVPAGAKLTDKKYSDAVDATVKSLRKEPGVASAVSPLSKAGQNALSKDKTIGYISLVLHDSPSELTVDDANRIIDAEQPARDAGMQVASGGYLGQKVSKPSTESSEAVGLTAAVIILLLTFGTVTAMGLPIITAILGLATGLSIIALLGQVVDVPTIAPTLATMIGLGVGIDYALFIVTRHKAQAAGGMDVNESIARSIATSGGAVAFAGGTVIIALVSLVVAGIPLVATLGYTAAIAVFVAVLGALTLLPAMLAILGRHIFSLKLPLPQPPHDHRPHGWMRWARFIARHPIPAVVLSVLFLLVLALPARNLHLGQTDTGALPTSTTARQANDLLTDGFGPGTAGPLLVSVQLSKPAQPDKTKSDDLKKKHDQQQKQAQQKAAQQQQQAIAQLEAQGVPPQQAQAQAQQQAQQQQAKNKQKQQASNAQYQQQLKALESPASDPRLTDLQNTLKKEPGVASVTPPLVNEKGTAAIYTVTPTTSPWDRKTEDLVKHLRATTLPAATKGKSMSADVGGRTAGFIDLADRISSKLPIVILVVVGLAVILLMLAFRSIAIPVKAGLMNVVSIAAAFGVVTFIFQEGHGAELLGLPGAVPIVSFVPLMMFAILFGLSMDYEVFLMSHMQEHYRMSGDNHEAVVDGLAATARVITSAAAIMVCVFGSFILNGDPTVKQFGVGLSVAILIDATVVRCVLVPAVMALMGDANWWFPAWAERALPEISIEGDEYFAERDRERELVA